MPSCRGWFPILQFILIRFTTSQNVFWQFKLWHLSGSIISVFQISQFLLKCLFAYCCKLKTANYWSCKLKNNNPQYVFQRTYMFYLCADKLNNNPSPYVYKLLTSVTSSQTRCISLRQVLKQKKTNSSASSYFAQKKQLL